MPRPDELGGHDGVVAVHRVVAADAHQRHVDRVALADQPQVGEQRGVAEVVDDLAAEARSRGRRACSPCPSAWSRCATPARAGPSRRRTRPCRRGSGRTRSPRRASPSSSAISTIATTCAPVRLAMSIDVAVVVGVAVRQEDVRRVDARRPRPRPWGCRSGTGRSRTRVSPSVSSKQA